jgi:hypothetical protein
MAGRYRVAPLADQNPPSHNRRNLSGWAKKIIYADHRKTASADDERVANAASQSWS